MAESRHRLFIEIDGDGSKAREEVRKVKQELESLKDKEVRVRVKVDQDGLRDLGQLGGLSRDAARGLNEHARASARASAAAREYGRAGRDAGKALRDLASHSERAEAAVRGLGAAEDRIRRLHAISGDASAQFKELGANASAAATRIQRLDQRAGNLVAGLDRTTTSLSAATDQALAHAEAMDRVNQAQRDYNRTVNRGAGGGGGGRLGGGGGGIPPIGGGGGSRLGGPGDDDAGGLNNWSRAATRATSAGQGLNSMLLRGAGYGALGGLIVGGVAELGAMALGFGAVLHNVTQSPAAMTAARGALGRFTEGMKESRSELNANAVPAFASARGAMQGLGREWGQLGAAVAPTAIDAVAGMARTAAPALDRLTPSVDRAVHAGGTLGSALINAAGNSGPALDRMSDSIEANARGIGKLTESAISFGSVVVSGALGAAGGLGNLLQPDPNTHAGRVDKALSDAANSDTMRWLGAAGKWVGGSLGDLMSPDTAGGPGWSARQAQRNAAYNAEAGAIKSGTLGEYDAAQASIRGVGGVPIAFNPDYSGPGQGPGPLPGQQVFQPNRRMPISSPRGPEFGQKDAITGTPDTTAAATRAGQMVPGGQTAPAPRLGPKGPGSSVGDASALQQYAQQLSQTGQTAITAGSQINQGMQTARAGTQGTAPVLQGQMAGAQAAVQGAQTVIPSAATAAFGAITSAAAAVQPAAAVAPAMQQSVKTVDDMSGAMSGAGAGLGASINTGAAAGMTATQEVPLTIIRKITARYVDEGAAGLDAHSPSRKFWILGQSIPQGLAGGTKQAAPGAERAVTGLAGTLPSIGAEQARKASNPGGGYLPAQVGENPRPPAPGEGAWLTKQAPGYASGFGPAAPPPRNPVADLRASREDRVANRLEGRGFSADTVDRVSRIQSDRAERADVRSQLRARNEGYALQNIGVTPEMQARQAQQRAENHARALRNIGVKESAAAGRASSQGFRDGARRGGIPQRTGAETAEDYAERLRRELGIASPSRVTASYGLYASQGFAQGVARGSARYSSVTDDSGLMLGYRYARSFGDGVTSGLRVINTQMLKPVTRPDIASDQAKVWLGAMGLLGAAGSGAQQYKLPSVTIGANSTPTLTGNVKVTVNLDGKPFREMVAEIVESEWEQFSNEYSGAPG